MVEVCLANCENWPTIWRFVRLDTIAAMRDLLIPFVHLIVTLARLAGPGGLRSVVAESVLVRHQLLILNRGRKGAPNLRTADRIIAGLCTRFVGSARVLRSAIVLNPSTLLCPFQPAARARACAMAWLSAPWSARKSS